MAVLCEMVSVIVRRDSIKNYYEGGEPAFYRAIPNRSMCRDFELVRVGFMTLDAASEYVAELVENGLQYHAGDDNSDVCVPKRPHGDIVVVDQLHGPLTACEWIVFDHVTLPQDNFTVLACYLSEAARAASGLRTTKEQAARLRIPDGWTVEEAKALGVGDDQEWERRYGLVHADAVMEAYLDKTTGQVIYMVPRNRRDH